MVRRSPWCAAKKNPILNKQGLSEGFDRRAEAVVVLGLPRAGGGSERRSSASIAHSRHSPTPVT